jgi:hypothetical protein
LALVELQRLSDDNVYWRVSSINEYRETLRIGTAKSRILEFIHMQVAESQMQWYEPKERDDIEDASNWKD